MVDYTLQDQISEVKDEIFRKTILKIFLRQYLTHKNISKYLLLFQFLLFKNFRFR
jgi:hypothetical protein